MVRTMARRMATSIRLLARSKCNGNGRAPTTSMDFGCDPGSLGRGPVESVANRWDEWNGKCDTETAQNAVIHADGHDQT